jgi:Protein of unknown function (DUF2852)
MSTLAARLDELPRPIWIALAILGFIVWWPLGLAIVACLIWSGAMHCCGFGFGYWRDDTRRTAFDRRDAPQPSGNHAFDEYRADTLQRLEAEQRAFHEFLSRLRMAKDKAEFDAFMADRRARTQTAPPPPPSPPSAA